MSKVGLRVRRVTRNILTKVTNAVQQQRLSIVYDKTQLRGRGTIKEAVVLLLCDNGILCTARFLSLFTGHNLTSDNHNLSDDSGYFLQSSAGRKRPFSESRDSARRGDEIRVAVAYKLEQSRQQWMDHTGTGCGGGKLIVGSGDDGSVQINAPFAPNY